jgi:hypothetical protein
MAPSEEQDRWEARALAALTALDQLEAEAIARDVIKERAGKRDIADRMLEKQP